ncbi:MAG: hypothetical protein WC565_01545 [Parcubacteria group bacterium]
MRKIAFLIFAVMGIAVFSAAPVLAWTNPAANPATGGGAVTAEQNAPASSILIKNTGGVWINTTTDTRPLVISRNGTDSERINIGITDGTTNFYYKNDEAVGSISFRIQNTDTETGGGAAANDNVIMTILGGGASYDNGRVGIGTASPSYKLSVAGWIQSTTGGFRFPDGTTQTTAASSSTVNAANVSAGTFGDNTGGGIYLFPSNIGFKSGVSSFTIRPISTTSMGIYDSAGAQVLVLDEGT